MRFNGACGAGNDGRDESLPYKAAGIVFRRRFFCIVGLVLLWLSAMPVTSDQKIGSRRKAQGARRRRQEIGKGKEDSVSINFPIAYQTLFHYT